MKSNSASLLVVVAAVVLAGCLGFPQGQPTTGAVGNGVIIKSFSPDFTEVRSGEDVTFSLLVENIGESDATEVNAQLFGLNFDERDWEEPAEVVQEVTLLRGANPDAGIVGDPFDFSWATKAPFLKVDNTYTANARVYYKYSTSAVSTLRFVTNDYIKSLPTQQAEQVRKTAGITSIEVSTAPVTAVLSVGTRPLIVYDGGEAFTLSIVITNAGSGNAFLDDATAPEGVDAASLHKIKISITHDSEIEIDCSTVLGAKTEGTITLIRGASKTMSCRVTAPEKEDVANTKDYTLSTDLSYGYFVDSSTTVKVLKSEEPSEREERPPARAENDFDISLSPSTGSTNQGGSVTSTALLTLTKGTVGSVQLSGTSEAQGVTVTFNPTEVAPIVDNPATSQKEGTTSTMKVQTSVATPVGTHKITVTATDGTITKTSRYMLTVAESVSFTPVCSIREEQFGESLHIQDTKLWYGTSAANFVVSVDPGTTNVEKVNFPKIDTLSGGDKDDKTSPYELSYDTLSTSTFSGTATFTVTTKTGQTASCDISLQRDGGKPTTTADISQVGTGYRIALACDDASGSGCQETKYCTDTKNTCTQTKTYINILSQPCTDKCYIRYKSTDNVNNAEETKSSTYGPNASPVGAQ